jgi:serine/threonine-protein kinase SRPK3
MSDYDDDEVVAWRYVPGPDECENLEGYCVGGYHPVEIGDTFCEMKYTIVHKLGAGNAATVWLAQTTVGESKQYVAMKILSASESEEDSGELRLQKHLQQQASAGHKLSCVLLLLDSFWIDGPNGKHLCFIFEAAGPSLSMIRRHDRKLRPDMARKLALQTAKGLQELHDAGVVYGDLSTNNVLLRLVNDFNTWTPEELYERLGHPEPDEVQTSDGQPIDSHGPKFVYNGIRFYENGLPYLKPEVAFIDLAEGRLTDETPSVEATGFSLGYAAPECLWFKEMQSQASDVWALACIWFELRSSTQMFEEFGGPEYVQGQIIESIGPLPAHWVAKLPAEDGIPEESQTEEADEQPATAGVAEVAETQSINPIRSRLIRAWNWLLSVFGKSEKLSDPESLPPKTESRDMSDTPEYFRPREPEQRDESLRGKLNRIGKWKEWFSLSLEERVRRMKEFSEAEYGHMTSADVDDEPPPTALSEEEKADLEDLLSSVLKYEKSERKTLKQVMRHAWFKKSYGGVNEDTWLKPFSRGWAGTSY